MNKNDLIQELSCRLSVPHTESRYYLNTLLDILSEQLSDGNNLVLQGFGTFSAWKQTERVGRNPRTGVSCVIRPRNSLKFKPGKSLLDRMNAKKPVGENGRIPVY